MRKIVTVSVIALLVIALMYFSGFTKNIQVKGDSENWSVSATVNMRDDQLKINSMTLEYKNPNQLPITLKQLKLIFPEEIAINKDVKFNSGYQLNKPKYELYLGDITVDKLQSNEVESLLAKGYIEITWGKSNMIKSEQINFTTNE